MTQGTNNKHFQNEFLSSGSCLTLITAIPQSCLITWYVQVWLRRLHCATGVSETAFELVLVIPLWRRIQSVSVDER